MEPDPPCRAAAAAHALVVGPLLDNGPALAQVGLPRGPGTEVWQEGPPKVHQPLLESAEEAPCSAAVATSSVPQQLHGTAARPAAL